MASTGALAAREGVRRGIHREPEKVGQAQHRDGIGEDIDSTPELAGKATRPLTRRAPALCAILATLALWAPPAHAAFPEIPFFKNVDGPVAWTSHLWSTQLPAGHTYAPGYWRAGFGLRFRPQTEDSVVSIDRSGVPHRSAAYEIKPDAIERDSSGTPKVTTTFKVTPRMKPGPITLSVGYLVDINGPEFVTPDFHTRLPLRGPYLGLFCGRELRRHAPMGAFVGAQVAFLDVRETSVAIDTVALKISSAQTVVPEGIVGLNFPISDAVFGFVEGSWQYVRLNSISYDKGPNSGEVNDALRRRLPRQIAFHAMGVFAGITFSAKGLQ